MSARSDFTQRRFAGVGKLHRGVDFGQRRRIPVSSEEIAFVHARRAAVPDISCGQLARLLFRQFGVDRSPSAIRNWPTQPTPITTNP